MIATELSSSCLNLFFVFSIRQQTKPLPTNISRSRFGGGPGMGGAAGFERDGIPQKIFERCGRSSF